MDFQPVSNDSTIIDILIRVMNELNKVMNENIYELMSVY